MSKAKLRPAAVAAEIAEDDGSDETFQLVVGDDAGHDHARRFEYERKARRAAFLGSYRFSKRSDNHLKEALEKSLGMAGEMLAATRSRLRPDMRGRVRLGFRVYRVTFVFPTLIIIMRCYVPWLHRDQLSLHS